MRRIRRGIGWLMAGGLALAAVPARAAAPADFYSEGVQLYQAGRHTEATEAFEKAARRRQHEKDALAYIERIRKETVERIRNKALTGVSKANWQTKYFFMNMLEGKVRVGISAQEVFERTSTHFRPGALEALQQLAAAIAKADNSRVVVELISEIRQETQPDPQLTAQQLSAVLSYLSLAARGNLPKD